MQTNAPRTIRLLCGPVLRQTPEFVILQIYESYYAVRVRVVRVEIRSLDSKILDAMFTQTLFADQ